MSANTAVEKQALIVGVVINLVMALSGWLAYYLSNSQALLLDGNYSFLIFLTTLVALKISSIKSTKTETFPFGQFVYEALYSLLKGVMIIGMLLFALTENFARIFHFIGGEKTNLLNTQVIMVYSLLMTLLCFGLAYYYHYKNKQINLSSSILRAEYSASIVDGFMSAGIGVALVGISYLSPESSFGFLNYIGDSILVVFLCFLLGKDPFILVRDSFIELAGGTLQNKNEKNIIESILKKHLPAEELLVNSYVSKTGSSYLVVAYFCTQTMNALGYDKTIQVKNDINNDLKKAYQDITFEIVLA